MPISYNGQQIIPAPFVSIREEPNKTGDGKQIGTTYVITLVGKFVAGKGGLHSGSGYPDDVVITSDGSLTNLLAKQHALRNLLKEEGKSLEIQGWNGSAPLKCNPRIREPLSTPEGLWYNVCDYSITFEADELTLNGKALNDDSLNYKVSEASENWDVEILDENLGTYRLVRQIGATGKRFFNDGGALDKEAWENAKDYVLERIELGLKPARMVAADVLDADDLQAFNYVRSQSLNELGGSFSVTESWLCYDPDGGAPAIEEYSVDVRTSLEGRVNVGVNGLISGLEVRDNSTRALVSDKWTNASAKWATITPLLLTRAETLSEITLHPTPINSSVGLNEQTGTINYSYEYDDRPNSTFEGASSQIVTQTFDNPADVYAEIPVLGRALGPVLQAIGTVTSRKKSVSLQVQMRPASQTFTPTSPLTSAFMETYRPDAAITFVQSDQESWSESTGSYSRNVTFTWEP